VTLNLSDVIPHDTDDAPAVARDDLSGVFVKLDKSAEWMIKAVGGSSAQRGCLRRTTLIEELRSKMNNGCVADADDPMASLCDVEQTRDTPNKKRIKYTLKRKNKVVDVDMPQCEPTRHPDCTSRKTVRLLGMSTNQVWLALPDIPWLLTWLADVLSTGGVPVPAPAPLAANSPAVAGVNFKWDFADSWEAAILTGPNGGTMIRTSVANFTEDKWAAVDAIHKYGVTFASSTYDQRKAATLHYLEAHCKRMADACESAAQSAP
jgi:hypothetical protein